MANFSWSGTWLSNTYYEVNTFVKYDNIAYVSTNSFQGSTTPPPDDMSNWNVFIIGYQQITPTPTPTIPESPTPTPTVTETPTNTPSHTPVGSPTNTPSVTETPTLTPTPTLTETPTGTPSETTTPTPTLTETPTGTPSETTTPTPTLTETPTGTPSETTTPTPTPTNTETPTQTPTPTVTETGTSTPTPTNTETPTGTPSETTTPTPNPTTTPTNTETPTNTPTPTNTETPSNTPTNTLTQTPTNTPTPTSTPLIVPENGLVLYLDAGDSNSYSGTGNQWFDISGNNNTGTLQNSPTYNPLNGGTLSFNGSNQYVTFNTPSNIPLGNSNYTISVWFNANSLGSGGFVGWGGYGGTNQVNALRLTTTGFNHYWWGNDLIINTPISLNTWYYVVARFNGTNREIWLNNVKIANDTPGSSHNVTESTNLTVGRTYTNEYFNGKLSNLEIYNRAISDVEMTEIYNDYLNRFT